MMLYKRVLYNTYVYLGESSYSWVDIISRWDFAMIGCIIGLLHLVLMIWIYIKGINRIKSNAVQSGLSVERARLLYELNNYLETLYVKVYYNNFETEKKYNKHLQLKNILSSPVYNLDDFIKNAFPNRYETALKFVDGMKITTCDIAGNTGIAIGKKEKYKRVIDILDDLLFPFDGSIIKKVINPNANIALSYDILEQLCAFAIDCDKWLTEHGESALYRKETNK